MTDNARRRTEEDEAVGRPQGLTFHLSGHTRVFMLFDSAKNLQLASLK